MSTITLQLVDQNGKVLNPSYIEDVSTNPTGIYDLIVEGDGNANVSQVYLKSNEPALLTGVVEVVKRQMNTNQSDDTALTTILVGFAALNAAAGNKILVHDFGKSENPIAFKVKVTTNFTPSVPVPSGGGGLIPHCIINVTANPDNQNITLQVVPTNAGRTIASYSWSRKSSTLANPPYNDILFLASPIDTQILNNPDVQPRGGLIEARVNYTSGETVAAYYHVVLAGILV